MAASSRFPLVLAAWLVRPAAGWVTDGFLMAKAGQGHSLHYAGKFCYDKMHEGTEGPAGSLDVEVLGWNKDRGKPIPHKKGDWAPLPPFPAGDNGLYLAVFADTNETSRSSWPEVRRQWSTLSCTDFLERATVFRPVMPSLPAGRFNASVVITDRERPRFLYFSFVFCELDAERATAIYYRIRARNDAFGFQREFSMEDRGVLWINLAGGVFFLVLFALAIVYAVRTYGCGAMRSRLPLQFVLCSCLLSGIGCCSLGFHGLTYCADGEGVDGLEVGGELCNTLARIMLSLLQLFMARGKALLSGENRARRTFLQLLVLGIVVLSMGCEVYGRFYGDTDWSTTLYFYESWPGTWVLVLNSVLFAEVCLATFELFQRQESDQQVLRLYKMTFGAAVVYFCALPVTVVMAHLLYPWNRKRTITRVEVTVRFIATAVLLGWFRPSKLDSRVAARLETPENRQNAVELADSISRAVEEQSH